MFQMSIDLVMSIGFILTLVQVTFTSIGTAFAYPAPGIIPFGRAF